MDGPVKHAQYRIIVAAHIFLAIRVEKSSQGPFVAIVKNRDGDVDDGERVPFLFIVEVLEIDYMGMPCGRIHWKLRKVVNILYFGWLCHDLKLG